MLLGASIFALGKPDPKSPGNPHTYLREYFPSVPDADNRRIWAIEELGRLGCSCMGFSLRGEEWDNPEESIKKYVAAAEENDIQLLPNIHGNYFAETKEERKRVKDQLVERVSILCKAIGNNTCGTAAPNINGIWAHRWRKDLPLEAQLERLAETVGEAARELHSEGISIAIENHCDYAADDILKLIDMVGGNILKVRIDPPNGVCVFEDPMDVIKKLGPHAVRAHTKGINLMPVVEGIGTVATSAPMGWDTLDHRKLLKALEANVPDPDNLPVIIEKFWGPAIEDTYQWYLKEIEYAQTELSEFWK